MLIDFHTHIFPEKIAKLTIDLLAQKSNGKPWTDGTVDGLVQAMERAGADICVALPVLTKPSQFDSVSRFALEVNERFKDKNRRIISFGGIHPACEDIEGKIKFLKNAGFKGVKIHPDYQETFIDDDGYIKILQCAKEYDMVVVTHAGVDDGYLDKPVRCPPELVRKVIEKVNHKKFVLGHYGGHKQWQEVLTLLAGKEVFFDTAFTLHEIDEEIFKQILDKHGDDKVLFASDCPWQDIDGHAKILKSYNLPRETEDKIFYKNALSLLNIGG